MQKLMFISALLLLTQIGYSQIFTLGPKAGANYSKLIFDENLSLDAGDYSLGTQRAKFGFTGGAFVQINALFINLQPEVLYSQLRSEIDLNAGGVDERYELNIERLDIPLLLGLNLGSAVRLQGGPVLTRILDADIKSLDAATDFYVNDYRTKGWGYQLGIGFDLGKVALDIRYQANLKKPGLNFGIGSETFDTQYRERNLQATLGFMLF